MAMKDRAVPSLSDETVTVAYLRSVTDEDAEAQLSDPVLWAYIVRDPTGAICSHGHGKTRKECEERAVVHAAECADEAWPESRMWLANKWEFLIWPPSKTATTRCGRIELKQRDANKTRKSKAQRLSQPQIDVLLLCVEHKLSRCWMGWFCDEAESERMYSAATINSLWTRGLLDANYVDPRIPCSDLDEVRKLDGAPKFQVWTSVLGRKLLEDEGLLLGQSEMLYH